MNKQIKNHFNINNIDCYYHLGSNNKIKILLRFLDGAFLVTNLHSYIPPQAFRWPIKVGDDSLFRVYLTIQDILPAIPNIVGLKEWKLSWKIFVSSIYEHAYGYRKTQVGELWFNDPYTVINNISHFLPVLESIIPYREKTITSLKQIIDQRYNSRLNDCEYIFDNVIKHLGNDKKIEIYGDHTSCIEAIQILSKHNSKIDKVYLLNPPTDRIEYASNKVVCYFIHEHILTKQNINNAYSLYGKQNVNICQGLVYTTSGRISCPQLNYLCSKIK